LETKIYLEQKERVGRTFPQEFMDFEIRFFSISLWAKRKKEARSRYVLNQLNTYIPAGRIIQGEASWPAGSNISDSFCAPSNVWRTNLVLLLL
jgi:hypothetical protein